MKNIEKQAQHNSNKEQKSFFSKKKIIVYLLITIIFGLLIWLMYDKIFNLDFSTVFHTIGDSQDSNSYFGLWIFLLLLFPIYNYFLTGILYWYKMKQKNIKVKWYEWFIFSGVNIFVRSITPFSIGGEPYAIYWMNKRGLTIKEATSIAASIIVAGPIAQILITWPSFFWMCSIYSQNINNTAWITIFWTILVGLTMDILSTSFLLLTSLSKHIHYAINVVINKFRKWFRLSYKTKDEIRKEFIENKEFTKMFISELKDIKFTSMVVLGNILYSVLNYISMYFVFQLTGNDIGIDFITMFNYVNVGVTANNFIPIPGGEGTLQGVLITLFSATNNSTLTHDQLVKVSTNAVFIWRLFTFYICAIVGVIVFIAEIFISSYTYKTKAQMMNGHKDMKKYSFVIPYENNHSQSITFFEWLIRDSYDDLDLEIIVYGANDKTKKLLSEMPLNKINVVYREYHYNGYDKILKDLKNNQLVTHDLFTILSPNTSLSFDPLYVINRTKKTYDIYGFNYLRKSKKFKFMAYIRPYKNFFIKEHKYNPNKKHKHLGLQNSFISSYLLNHVNLDELKRHMNIDDLNYVLLSHANSVRTYNKSFGCSPVLNDSNMHASNLFVITKLAKTMYI